VDDEEEYIPVRLHKRTPEELLDYLILQYSLLTVRVEQLEGTIEQLEGTIGRLMARLETVERATPWKAPKR
jgi:prefoldin subunit 5